MPIQLGDGVVNFFGDDRDLQKKLKKLGKSMKDLAIPAAALGAAIGAAFTFSVKAASDFESAFIGVQKTVDATTEGYGRLREGLLKMTRVIPKSADELAGLMEVAGQLGIKGEEALLKFTKTMAMLADTTNIVGEEGSLQLARFMNIMGTSTENVERLGSSLVDLGNNFAATEAEILFIGKGLASFGNKVGISDTAILGLATTIAASGGEAQAAATAFQKLGLGMQTAVLTGSEKLEVFARTAGVSVGEFSRLFKEDAMEAITLFLEGLKDVEDQGQSSTLVLGELGLADQRLTREIGKVTANLDKLREATELSDKAFQENTALAIEAEKRYGSFDSQIKLLKNAFRELQIGIGTEFLPDLVKLIKKAKEVIFQIIDWKKENEELFATITKVVAIVGTVSAGFAALVLVIMPVIKAIGLFIGAMIGFLNLPIILAIAAIIGIVKLLKTAWDKNWFGVQETFFNVRSALLLAFWDLRDKLIDAWDTIKTKVGAIVTAIADRLRRWKDENQETIDLFVQNVKNVLLPLWERIKTSFINAWEGMLEFWDEISPDVMQAFNVLVEFLLSTLEDFLKWWNENWETIRDILILVWDVMTDIAEKQMKKMQAAIKITLMLIRGDWKGIWNEIKTFYKEWWAGLLLDAEGFIEDFKGLWRRLLQWLAERSLSGSGDFLIRVLRDLGLVQNFARGGVMPRSGRALVGERGPEIVNLPAGASVRPNTEINNFTQQGANVEVILNIGFGDPSIIIPAIKDAFRKEPELQRLIMAGA